MNGCGKEKMSKILIIDDNRCLAEILDRFLMTFGYPEATLANDGGEGLLFLKENPEVALVFTDLAMPNVNGEELIQKSRESGYTGKIILMSGQFPYDVDMAACQCRGYRVDAKLPKPFLPHKVLDALTIAGVNPSMFK